MFDPRIPPPFPIVEDDLVYVVTGYNKINSFPDSRETSIRNLRQYLVTVTGISGVGHIVNADYGAIFFSTSQESNLIDINYSSSYPYHQSIATTGLNAKFENLIVRQFESAWPYSGVIYNTGLNARVGNNMEIQFAEDTPADYKYGGVGGKYLSGIISTTGLNARSENLIVRDFESSWPHSGVVYNTGLNARAGNLIEIQYQSSSPAGGIYGGTEGKYKSGIISTTGLNMLDGSNIGYTIGTSFPHKYTIFTVDQAKTTNNSKTFYNNNYSTSPVTSGFIDPELLIDYSSLYTSKPGETISLLSSLKLLIDDFNVAFTIPSVGGLGGTDSNKQKEFASISGVAYSSTLLNGSCAMVITQVYNPSTDDYDDVLVCQSRSKTFTDMYDSASDLSNWEVVDGAITANTFFFYIGCSGGFPAAFAKYPISFTNTSGQTFSSPVYGGTYTFGSNSITPQYRSETKYPNYVLGNIDPMEIEYFQQLIINSNTMTSSNTTSPIFYITDFQYTRRYRKLIGYTDSCVSNTCTANTGPVYRYHTATMRGPTSFTIEERSFRTKNV
jgi:hypothetical protein